MKVKLAKTAGFCFGVKRAVETVYKEIEKNPEKPIYTYGPIIHNDEVIKDMERRNVRVIHSDEELTHLEKGIVIIRSHGVSRMAYDKLKKYGMNCVDATCPFVKKIHKIVEQESKSGNYIVVIGNEAHPEVEGIVGWVKGDYSVVQTVENAQDLVLPEGKKVCIVSQTTFNYNKFKELVEIIAKKSYDINVLNTICSATMERQTEAKTIAEEVDAMIVIGDKKSSNSQKLFEICNTACKATYFIQTLDDLDTNQLRSVDTVGITAGASTPNNIIEEVQNNVRIIF